MHKVAKQTHLNLETLDETEEDGTVEEIHEAKEQEIKTMETRVTKVMEIPVIQIRTMEPKDKVGIQTLMVSD